MSHFGDPKLAKELQVGETALVQLTSSGWAWAANVPSDPHIECAIATVSKDPTPNTATTYTIGILIHGNSFASEITDDTFALAVGPHHPVCDDCKEPWPCRDHRLTVEARNLTRDLDNVCAHCGKALNGSWYETYFDGVTQHRYHTAQKYKADGIKCVDALAAVRSGVVEPSCDKRTEDT